MVGKQLGRASEYGFHAEVAARLAEVLALAAKISVQSAFLGIS